MAKLQRDPTSKKINRHSDAKKCVNAVASDPCCCGACCDATCVRVLFHTYPDVPAISGTEWFLKPVPGVPCAFSLVNCEIFPPIDVGYTNITMLVKLSIHPVDGEICVSYFAGGLTAPGILPHAFPTITDIHDSPIACALAFIDPPDCDAPMYLPLPGADFNPELIIEFNIDTVSECVNDCDVSCCTVVRSFMLSGAGFEWEDGDGRDVGYTSGLELCVPFLPPIDFSGWVGAWGFYNCYPAVSYGINICSITQNAGYEPDECLLTEIIIGTYYFDGECRLWISIRAWKNGLSLGDFIPLFYGTAPWNPASCSVPILFDTNEADIYFAPQTVPPELLSATVTITASDITCPPYTPPPECVNYIDPPPDTPCPGACFECNEECGERCWTNSYITIPYAIATGECGTCTSYGNEVGEGGCRGCLSCIPVRDEFGVLDDSCGYYLVSNDGDCLGHDPPGHIICKPNCTEPDGGISDCSFIDYEGSIELGFSGIDGAGIHFADIITIGASTIEFDIWFNCGDGRWYASILINGKCEFTGDLNGGCTVVPGITLAGSDITIDGSVCELVGALTSTSVHFMSYTCPE